jgi:septal ring factor EnvC (AmiA/AmiB activator)
MRCNLMVLSFLCLCSFASFASTADKANSLVVTYKSLKSSEQKIAQAEKIFAELDKMVADKKTDKESAVEAISEAIFATYKIDIVNELLTEKIVKFFEKNNGLFEQYFAKKKAGLDPKALEKQELLIKILESKMLEFRAVGG